MKKNVHDYERIVRVAAGIFLTSMAFWGPRRKLFLGFLTPVVTGFTGKCPIYSALGVSTRKEAKTERELANEYEPVQAPSERAVDHPIVGVS